VRTEEAGIYPGVLAEHVGRDLVEVLVHGLDGRPARLVRRGGVGPGVGHPALLPLLLHGALLAAQPHHHRLPLLLVLRLQCGTVTPLDGLLMHEQRNVTKREKQ